MTVDTTLAYLIDGDALLTIQHAAERLASGERLDYDERRAIGCALESIIVDAQCWPPRESDVCYPETQLHH